MRWPRCSSANVNRRLGCLQSSLTELVSSVEYSQHLGRNWQNSIGIAHQIGSTMAFEADYVHAGPQRKGHHRQRQPDVQPGHRPFDDASRRAFPDWGSISLLVRTGRSAYHGLQTSFTKRLSNRWQGSATYTLSGLWDAESMPLTGDAANTRFIPVPFQTAPDMGGEWALS